MGADSRCLLRFIVWCLAELCSGCLDRFLFLPRWTPGRRAKFSLECPCCGNLGRDFEWPSSDFFFPRGRCECPPERSAVFFFFNQRFICPFLDCFHSVAEFGRNLLCAFQRQQQWLSLSNLGEHCRGDSGILSPWDWQRRKLGQQQWSCANEPFLEQQLHRDCQV